MHGHFQRWQASHVTLIHRKGLVTQPNPTKPKQEIWHCCFGRSIYLDFPRLPVSSKSLVCMERDRIVQNVKWPLHCGVLLQLDVVDAKGWWPQNGRIVLKHGDTASRWSIQSATQYC